MQVPPVTLRSASVSAVSAGPSLAQAFVAAAEAIGRVSGGESLNTALADLKRRASAETVAAAAQDLCYNALRGYGVVDVVLEVSAGAALAPDRKSTRLNSSHTVISYAVFCLKKKKRKYQNKNNK